MSIFVFTRASIREIVPEISSKAEDGIIDLYLAATYRLKRRIAELEAENRALEKSSRSAAKLLLENTAAKEKSASQMQVKNGCNT